MLKALLDFSIRRRRLVVVLTLAAAGIGVWSLNHLPIDAVPDITNNQVTINTIYPDLSVLEIESQVTFPVEMSLAGIPGLESTRSLSRNGFSQVTAVFRDDVDVYFARQQAAERLIWARDRLPPGAVPRMGPVSTGLGEIYMWAVDFTHPGGKGATVRDGEPGWQSDGSYLSPEGDYLKTPVEQITYLRTVQDWIIAPQLRMVEGVAGVDSIGGYVKQYHVQPDPVKLAALGLSLEDVVRALERNNVSTGAGYIERHGEAWSVRASGRIGHIDEIGEIPVQTRNGIPVRIRDVAITVLGTELRTGSASDNGHEAVVGTALMLVGANSREVARAVDLRMQEVRKSLPPGIEARTVLNRTRLVEATIKTVRGNLTEGAILVIVILFVMLGNLRAAIICALAIPLSMLMAATGMVRAGISGNLMSLGAIDFGLVVDGAVIIVENCVRRLALRQHELGRPLTLEERLETVFDASRQVRSATAFGEAIIITVYLPMLALTGVEGKMFHPMALTVIFALVSAFILSLTFVPAMVALIVRGHVEEKENRITAAARRIYQPVLQWALQHRWPVLLLAAGIFALSVFGFSRLGQEFVPVLDEKDMAIHAMRIPATSLSQSTQMQLEVERTLSRFPEVAFVFSKTGTAEMAGDPMPPNVSDTFVILKDRHEWPDPGETKEQLRERMERALEQLPGNSYEFTQPIQMRFNELIAGIRADVAVKIYGDDPERMTAAAGRIATILRDIPGAADVKVEQTAGLPMLTVRPDRERAARHGISVADIQENVSVAVGGKSAGVFFEGDRRFDLVVRLPEAVRTDPEMLKILPLARPDGLAGFIPLSEVASLDLAEGPNQISRENGKRRVVVQANVRGRDIASFVAEAQKRIEAGAIVPSGYWLDWGGQFENLQKAQERLLIVVPVCFALIFLLLYSTFGSAGQAILVFSAVPFALSGGVASLWLRGMPFSISAAVGFIALSGVAVLNGLVMVTFINQLREAGKSVAEAVEEGALTRLRPVLMTALVAAFGFVPMALATGTGAEVQRPIATVVVGGIISSTLLTLVVLPVLYRITARENT